VGCPWNGSQPGVRALVREGIVYTAVALWLGEPGSLPTQGGGLEWGVNPCEMSPVYVWGRGD
jgi:hypothetical protein